MIKFQTKKTLLKHYLNVLNTSCFKGCSKNQMKQVWWNIITTIFKKHLITQNKELNKIKVDVDYKKFL